MFPVDVHANIRIAASKRAAGGRISIIKTIGLRARRLIHQIVFDRPTLTRQTQENRIFTAALIEIGRIAQVATLQDADMARAQGLSLGL